ncbi:hypothetical protein JMJ77_0012061 [Colletotrichum scovillei]|uniref:Uncharacterized protein n=1 Tax=Colletotrichum scovillei TaxID=1209932 RepID=A0A9P7U6M1_9PEZI|nr:hypothetical protein JMJ77_0012061 [Colletotrichum scovillei]KAG7046346.1 hypothetical protein JMJ78_0011410 [Colletotrichum scovillei]KAG7063698.1 hypothetical protein JMJ76_0006157 [Colletotrichum scovillei]
MTKCLAGQCIPTAVAISLLYLLNKQKEREDRKVGITLFGHPLDTTAVLGRFQLRHGIANLGSLMMDSAPPGMNRWSRRQGGQ